MLFETFCIKIGWGLASGGSHRNDVSPLTQGLNYHSYDTISIIGQSLHTGNVY